MNLKLHNTLQTLPGAISNVHLVVDVVPENVVHAWKLPATGHKQVFLRQLHSTSAFQETVQHYNRYPTYVGTCFYMSKEVR